MKLYLNSIFFVLFCCFSTGTVFAQQTIEEKKELANAYFEEGKFDLAEPLFAAVIADSPRNHDLNFKYGTCLLYASKDREEAIRRLRFSLTIPSIDVRAYYYLGRAYHLNYQFNDALSQYAKFKEKATVQDLKVFNVTIDIEACNYGKKLLANVMDMIVIQKTELNQDKFYDLYKLDDIGGQLIITSEFQTKLDRKKEHRPIIHFPSKSPYIYYSSYGEDGATGLDIYVKKKLPGGEWSMAQKVKGNVNTDEDEDFAYMHPNGDYLYFSSRGHNSMGGYDVFRSKYNPDDDSFGLPENMDFAISSPDDDLLFIVDSLNRIAYFSSARESGEGKIMVYKVRVERIPMQMAVIKGSFLNTINADGKELEIAIEDFSNGREIGVFNTKSTNGDYLITFPKSGKYSFYMTVKGSDETHLAHVDIPYFKDFRPLKQQLTLKLDDNGEQQILVENLFNEEFEDPTAIMAEVYRELSKLPPNANNFNLDSLDALKKTDEIFVSLGLDPYSTAADISLSLNSKIDDINKTLEKDEQASAIAYNLSTQKSNEANEKMLALNDLLMQADASSDKERIQLLEKAVTLQAEVEKLNEEAINLLELGELVDKEISQKKKERLATEKVLAEIENLPKDNRNALISVVSKNEVYFKANANQKQEVVNSMEDLVQESAVARKKSQETSEDLSEIIGRKNSLLSENKRIENQIQVTKKQKEKDLLQRDIDENNSEIAVLDKQILSKQQEIAAIQNDNKQVKFGELAEEVIENQSNQSLNQKLSDEDKANIIAEVKKKDLTEDLIQTAQVLDENKISNFNIDLFASSEQTDGFTMLEWSKAIDGEQERLRLERETASAKRQAEIDAEFERLERLRAEKLAQFTVVEEDPNDIKPSIDPNDIVDDYEIKKEGIGEIVNEKDRRFANLELNQELAIEIERERKKLTELIEENPKNKNIKERLANLEVIENELKNEIDQDQNWLAENEDVAFDKDKVIYNLDPSYQSKINQAYTIIDEDERNREIASINGIVLEKANERIQELTAIIEGDEKNENAKAELEYLGDFINTVAANKALALVDPVTLDLENLSTKPSENELISDFDERLAQSEEILDERNRKMAENELYNELLAVIDLQISELDRLAEKNPDNKDIGKRKDKLIGLKEVYQAKNNKNENWLDENKEIEVVTDLKVNTSPDKVDVLPSYNKELSEIENSAASAEDKNKQRIALNTNLIESIEKELTLIDSLKKENPAAKADLEKRAATLGEMKISIQNELNNLELDVKDIAAKDSRQLFSIETIMPLYAARLTDIENTTSDKAEGLKRKNALNEELLSLIENKKQELEAEAMDNPDQALAIEKELAQLVAIEKEKKEAIISNNVLLAELSGDSKERPAAAIATLLPNFEAELTAIKNGPGTDTDKMEAENSLQANLIQVLSAEIERLEKEKINKPNLTEQINGEINTYKDLQRIAQNQIQINKDLIAQQKSNELNRPAITIGSLVNEFDQRMAEIENSKAPEIEKLNAKNTLNNELLNAIENKLTEIQEEWEEDPNNGYIYNEEISKLEELKEAKLSEVAKTNEEIDKLLNDELSISSLKPSDFSSDQGKNTIGNLEKELEQITSLNQDLAELNQQKSNAETDKDKEKVQKLIDKKEKQKAALENEVINELSQVNQNELSNGLVEVNRISDAGKSNNTLDEDLAVADANVEQAKSNITQANNLRNEANDLKDPVLANEKLTEAIALEFEAKELLAAANRTYKMAKVQDKYATEDVFIVAVPENIEDRTSTKLMNESDLLERKADQLNIRAQELIDSSATVKKKNRDNVLAEADLLSIQANEFSFKAKEKEEQANSVKFQEEQLLSMQSDTIQKDFTTDEVEVIATSEPYKQFVEEQQKGEEKLLEVAAIEDQVDALKDRKTRKIKMAVVTYGDKAENELDNDEDLVDIQREIDSLRNRQNELKESAAENFANANQSIAKLEPTEQENIIALKQKGIAPKEIELAVNTDFDIPDKIETSIFRKTDAAIYSDGAPIPINEKVTSGLVYKVQVGAFRNPLPQDHFKEFAPISGQKLNNGITRYMVGYFQKFAPAFEAKKQVNDLGYTDAFVVAYCNGDRITIERAKLIEEGLISCEGKVVADSIEINTVASTTSENNTENNTSENNTENNTTESDTDSKQNDNIFGGNQDQSDKLNITATTPEEQQLIAYYTAIPNAAKANQVEIIKGLFYTVQIGVYSKPVPLEALFNIQPLNSQRTASGVIRYSTGIFTSEEAATKRKDEIVGIGISDAFVTAYFDGERITLEQALAILKRDGADAFVGKKESNLVDKKEGPKEEFKESFLKEGLYYRILLGKFENAIPGEYATILLQGENVLETEVDQEGRTCITSLKIETFDAVLEKVKEFGDLGIEDMDIITFYKYDVIPFEEGRKIELGEDLEKLNPYDEMVGINANPYLYNAKAIYFKIKLGVFEDKVPSDFTNLLLQYEDEEGINKEETINDEIVFMTNSINNWNEAEAAKARLVEKGFVNSQIIAFHKYDEISVEKAREVIGQ